MKNKRVASVSANLPSEIRSFMWVRNHHYVALKDIDGNEIKLDATTILLGECVDRTCGQRFAVFTNQGEMVCPHCKGAVKWLYARAQLAFIAEHESQFMGLEAHRNKSDK